MRTARILVGLAFIFAADAGSALAQDHYAGFQFGFTGGGGEDYDFNVDLEFQTGTYVSGFLGKDLGNTRIEGEIAYRHNDMDNWGGLPASGEMSSLAVMGNFYYDFGSGPSIVPYIGFGLGFASITMNSTFYNTFDTDTTFALQLMAGLSIPIDQRMSIVVDLRSIGAVPRFTDTSFAVFEHGYGVGSLSAGLVTRF